VSDSVDMKDHPHIFSGEAWPFSDLENAASFVCVCVHRRQKPLLRVVHDEDGEWQFLCGDEEHLDPMPVIVCLGCMIERKPSLLKVAKLPMDACAGRASETEEWEW
jgi:hypothetical protein